MFKNLANPNTANEKSQTTPTTATTSTPTTESATTQQAPLYPQTTPLTATSATQAPLGAAPDVMGDFTELLEGTNYSATNNHDDDDNLSVADDNGKQKQTVQPLISRPVSRAESRASFLSSQQPALAPSKQISLESILVHSTLAHEDNDVQQINVVTAFNRDAQGNQRKESDFIVRSNVRGERIEPGTFKVFHFDHVPILVAPSTELIATKNLFNFVHTNEKMPAFPQDQPYFQAKGVHIINVPPGSIARIADINKRKFLSEGVHVIHSQTLKFDEKKDFIHLAQPLIQHGTYNILRIPVGKIARVTVDGQPMLLEGRPEPFVYNDPTFRLFKKDDLNEFYDNTDQLIIHGSIKRVLPHIGEVAVSYNGSTLVILDPKKNNGEAFLITDKNHSVIAQPFLQTNINRVTYPDLDEPAQIATTQDGVKVKLRLDITYSIPDPELAVTKLASTSRSPHDEILKHVESSALADMTKVTQSCNFSQAQESNHSHAQSSVATSSTSTAPSAPDNWLGNIQDKIKSQLKLELAAKGIELGRCAFKEFMYDDLKFQQSLIEIAQRNQKLYGEVSAIEQQGLLSREKAHQEAQVALIQKQAELERTRLDMQRELVKLEGQANQQATVTRINAQAELDAAKMRAQSVIAAAEAEAKSIELKAKAELNAISQIVAENPLMMQLLIAREQAKALAGIQSMIVSPETASAVYAIGSPAFFKPTNAVVQVVQQEVARAPALGNKE